MLLSDVIQDPYVRLSDFLEILMVSKKALVFREQNHFRVMDIGVRNGTAHYTMGKAQ